MRKPKKLEDIPAWTPKPVQRRQLWQGPPQREMTRAEYFRPNTAVRSPVPSGEWWTPPEKSKGLRHFKFTSKGNSRGAAVVDDVSVESESGIERKCMLVLRARPDTLRLVEQTPRIEYVGADGEVHEHFFDLKVFKTCGRTVAFDVKPSALVAGSGIREQHILMAPQMSRRDADAILLMTERMFSYIDLFNAKEMRLAIKQDFYPEDDETVGRLIDRMKGPTPIADLVAKSRLAGYGFNAVVRAIAVGRLRMTETRMIDYPAVVAPVRTEA
ncbi:hypothetical protein BDS110ZK4_30280 [Bradyrhizobium diazoefficiens]|uniref:TnsA endonuclease N-terminal domain-containing protein n=1 Tax=Bradyrhizobium diazoefficiens TaxID=1355477 RepID=A0A809ZBM1_9BRAD|nr:hypothetical protein XF4B_44990 [Bradyrhizobium diazoefficiens]BCE91666.1 hypothetical protein XF10B_44640 [Bradyrhizobium diazoefficiens]